MDDLPKNYTQHLPAHMAVSTHGGSHDVPCTGETVSDVSMDVGVCVCRCSICGEEFVYLPKTDVWVTQKDFDMLLQKKAGEMGMAILSL
jgi:hypothetical protein